MSKIKFIAIFLLEAIIIKIITQILRHTSGYPLNSEHSMMYLSMSITLVYIKDIVINKCEIIHKYLPYL